MSNEDLPAGTYVAYQIRGAFDHGRGAGTIISMSSGMIDGHERTFYFIQDEQRKNLRPAVLPDEITKVGR